MSTNLEAERYPFELCVEGKTIRQQKVIRTTLGDLIAAVTDEVKPLVRDPSGLYMVVSYIIDHRVFVWVISGHFRGQAACT